MKLNITKFKLFAAALLAAFFSHTAWGNANVQVIHNCADPAAASVDVYINGALSLNNFAFRSATNFLSVPSGVPINIGIAPANSTSVNDTIVSFLFPSLANNENYVLIASGVVAGGFASNPDGRNTGFDLKVITPARTAANNSGQVDFAIFHGATDAPGVDVKVSGGGPTLATNAKFGDATSYLSVNPTWYPIDILPAGGSTPVASYVADLSGLAGGAAVVFASGFLNPAANNNGAPFGLYAALANGTVVTLPLQTFAKLQVIHNCAAPGADSVDVYLDGEKAIPNFKFRTAIPFINVLAGVNHTVAVAPPNSTSASQALATFPGINLTSGQNYIAVASGVVGTGFASNPDGRNINFDLKLITPARTAANNSGQVDFAIFHGATDAPGVDVKVSGGGPTLATNAKFGDATSYLSVNPTWYPIDILPAGGSTPVASYVADLSGLAGGAAVVFASGFLNPAANNNGAAFGLFAALANGTVEELPLQTFAKLQVIHNCAAPGADSVDVYLDGEKAIPNFKFRTAIPFINVLAGVNHTVAVAPPNSTSASQPLATFPGINLTAGENYVVVASGVVGTGFATNPDGRDISFDLKIISSAQTEAADPAKVDFAIFHGSTDAPGVDVKVAGGGPTLASNAKYGDATNYLTVDPASYIVDIHPAGAGTPLVSYVADLTALTGGAAVVFASGFLNPAANNNGAPFGLFAALPNGTVAALGLYNSIQEAAAIGNWNMYPNPNNGVANFQLELNRREDVVIQIMDMNGRMMKEIVNMDLGAGPQRIEADLTGLANGMYISRIVTSENSAMGKFSIAR